jgi:hypothetical protein
MVALLSIRAIRGQVFSLSEWQQDESKKHVLMLPPPFHRTAFVVRLVAIFAGFSGISSDHTEPLGRLLRFY